MTKRSRLVLFTTFIALFLTLNGCVKLSQAITVMPDGSGKIELRFGLSQQQVALAEENEQDPFKEVLPDVMKNKTRGVVAITEPKRSKEKGFSYLAYTMYFRDINKLRITALGEGKPARYRYTREADGATLTLTHGTVLSMIADYQPRPEAERDEVRKEMARLAFSEQFTLPGEIKPIDGLETKSNTARLDLTVDHLLDGTGPIKQLKGKNQITFAIDKITVSEQAAEAFKKELDEAVAAWQERLKGAN